MDSSLLNNREMATILWLIVAAIFFRFNSKYPDIKKSLLACFKAFTNHHILKLFSLIVIYYALITSIVVFFTTWNSLLLKNMIVCFFLVGLYPLTKMKSLSDNRDKAIKEIAKSSIALAAFVEFFVAAFPFNLAIEFFIIIPLSLVFGAIMGYTANGRDENVYNFTLKVSSVIGLGLVVHSTYIIYSTRSTIDFQQLCLDFGIPIATTILYIPFLYLFATYLTYERCFNSLQFKAKESDISAIKRYAVLTFRTDIGLLERWSRCIYGKMSLDEAIRKGSQFLEIKRYENNPPPVRESDGWSPYIAENFLTELGMETNGYHENSGYWGASSTLAHLGNRRTLQNTIAYYVEGSKLIAKTLRLSACIINIDEEQLALDSLAHASILLFEKAMNKSLSPKLIQKIIHAEGFKVKTESYLIKLYKEEWADSQRYDLRFSIHCSADK